MTTAVQVQYRRGTSSQVAPFTGAQGEMVVDTTNNRLVVQDGSTAGGWPAAKLSEVVTNTRTQVSDANYTAQATDRTIAYIALTAARIISLPAAASYPTGSRLLVVDESGACSATKTITLSANGSDLIDGVSTAVISSGYGYLAIESNSSNKWTIVDQTSSINGLTGAISIASSGGSSVTASGSIVTIGEPGGMLNKFRNGTMDVWKRSTSGTATTAAGASTQTGPDGWYIVPTGASVSWAQAGGRSTTKNSLQVMGASSVTDLIIKQRIESYIAAALSNQTVTVQAQVYNNTGASVAPTLSVKHANSQDSWGSSTTDVNGVSLQSCANRAWTQISYTFSASASSYNGVEISFDFGNNVGSSSNSIQITELDVRVTPGVATGLNSNPPPPELRSIFTERLFCGRYFYSTYTNAAPGTASADGVIIRPIPVSTSVANGQFFAWEILPVPMRAIPTVAIYGFGGTSSTVSSSSGVDLAANSGTLEGATSHGFAIANTSGGSVSTTGYNVRYHFTASAEL